MIELTHRTESLYQSFYEFRSILRENFPRDNGLTLSFYSNNIRIYQGLNDQLIILDKAFTAYFGIGDYRNLVEIIRLVCFIKFGGINVEEIPIIFQLNFNGMSSHTIHHDGELTPVILSQLPYPEDFTFGKRNYGADVETETVMIELGDTFVRKVVNGLDDYDEVWVIPIRKENRVKDLENVYKFTRGNNWGGVELWQKQEEDDDHKIYAEEISKVWEKYSIRVLTDEDRKSIIDKS